MTREEAEEYAKEMTYRDAINNLMKARSIPYRKATFIKINELLKALEQEPCDDAISRKSIKHKLQEHHDFFVNAYGGFSNLPQNDKARVDEITNCIAMVVNEPPVKLQEPKTGHWIGIDEEPHEDYECEKCGYVVSTYTANIEPHTEYKFCPNCGCRMFEPQEGAIRNEKV